MLIDLEHSLPVIINLGVETTRIATMPVGPMNWSICLAFCIILESGIIEKNNEFQIAFTGKVNLKLNKIKLGRYKSTYL